MNLDYVATKQGVIVLQSKAKWWYC